MIKILFVEDLETDVELAIRAIKSEKIIFDYQVVDTEKEYIKALDAFSPDIIVSDYSMPGFDGMRALNIARAHSNYFPFIVLTGSMNEETAVACMKAGANDYVIKEQITRLPFAIKEEIEHNQQRIKREEIEKQLIESEEKFRSIFYNHSAVKMLIDPTDHKILEANKAAANFYGWSVVQLENMLIDDINILPTQDLNKIIDMILSRERDHFESRHRCANGQIIDVEVFTSNILINNKEYLHYIVHDISEKKKAEQRNILLNRSIEQSPVSIVITNKDGEIEYVNPAFTRLTGYQFDEAIGKNPNILNSGHHQTDFFKDMWDKLMSGQDWKGEILNKKKDGSLFWEDMIISPILNIANEITHFIAVKEDISEKKKMVEDLLLAKKKAEESDQLKSAFLANMSHEIRTPMNGILGFTELLREPDLTGEEMQQYISIIQSSGKRMMDTLNSIIEISKIETGQVITVQTKVDLTQELTEATRFFSLEASNKGLELILNVPSQPVKIDTDRYKLQSVLTNLIKNSIKYTAEGEIEVGYSQDGNQVTVYVKDTGMGIPQEKQKSIFNRFEQADLSLTRGHEGSGLGLAISKAYVEMLSGEIWVESAAGKGSTFWFSLPV